MRDVSTIEGRIPPSNLLHVYYHLRGQIRILDRVFVRLRISWEARGDEALFASHVLHFLQLVFDALLSLVQVFALPLIESLQLNDAVFPVGSLSVLKLQDGVGAFQVHEFDKLA